MPFSGKATYTAGVTLPEIAEDVSDIVGLVSPWETPLLDHLGDPRAEALSTRHEWMEDTLLPNSDQINQTTFTPSPTLATAITVDNADRFQVGDQVRPEGSVEVMLVTAVAGSVITVVRGYGNTTRATIEGRGKPQRAEKGGISRKPLSSRDLERAGLGGANPHFAGKAGRAASLNPHTNRVHGAFNAGCFRQKAEVGRGWKCPWAGRLPGTLAPGWGGCPTFRAVAGIP